MSGIVKHRRQASRRTGSANLLLVALAAGAASWLTVSSQAGRGVVSNNPEQTVLLYGGGSGAVAGYLIGKDAKSALIGAAVGTVTPLAVLAVAIRTA